MKYILSVLVCFVSVFSQAQAPFNRSSASVTAIDARLRASLNFGIPIVADTTLNGGLDSLGSFVYSKAQRSIFYRDSILTGGHKWIRVIGANDPLLTPTWQTVLNNGSNLNTQDNASTLNTRTFAFNMVPGDFGNTGVTFGGNTTTNAPNIVITGDAQNSFTIPARLVLEDVSTNNRLELVNDLNESNIMLTGVGVARGKVSFTSGDVRLVTTNVSRLKELRNASSDSGLIVNDKYDTVGLSYFANYRGIGIVKKGDRWIPDKGYVDSLVTSATAGSGINNTNVGSGFRVLSNPSTQTLRTVFSSNTIGWDSTSNSNGLTAKADTSVLATQYDILKIRDSSFNYASNGATNKILYSKSYYTSASDFTATSLTPSIVNNGIRVTLGDGTFNKFLTLNNAITTDENLRIELTFKISNTLAAGHFGLAVGRRSVNPWYNPSIVAQYDPITKLIKIIQTDNTTVLAQKNLSYTPAQNDIIHIVYYQEANRITAIFENQTQALVDYLTVTGNLGAIKNLAPPNTSQPVIHEMGGQNDIVNLKISSASHAFPYILCIGDSKTFGYSVNDLMTTWPRIIDTFGIVNVFAGDGDRTVEAVQTILNSISYGGKYVILAIGRNDLASGVPTLTWQANYISLRDTIVAAGFTIIHLLPIPETNVPDQSALKNFIQATFPGDLQIDPSVGWVNATMLSGDGVHPNEFGARFIANLIKASGYITPTTNPRLFTQKNQPFGLFAAGSGTLNTVPLWTGTGTLGNSPLTVASSVVTSSNQFEINIAANEKLSLNGSGTGPILRFNTNGSSNMFIQGGTTFSQIATSGNTPFQIAANGITPFRVTTLGTVEIGTPGFDVASATLNLSRTDRGMLFNRLNTTQQTALSAAPWLIILNTDSAALVQRNGSIWEAYATRNWVRTQGFITGNTLYTGDGTATSRTVTVGTFLNFAGANVGFGTAGPDRKVDILDASNPQLRLSQTDGTNYTDFQTNSSGYLQVTASGGRVGIGVAPTAAFHVSGSVKLDLEFPQLNSQGDLYYRNSGGTLTSLGIGTSGQVVTSSGTVPTWATPNFLAGAYTPTLTNGANVSASTAYVCQYMQVGNVVTVSGRIDIDPTAPATLTSLGISLPVASSFSGTSVCAGTAAASELTDNAAAVRADVANSRAELRYLASDITNHAMYFTFTYIIAIP